MSRFFIIIIGACQSFRRHPRRKISCFIRICLEQEVLDTRMNIQLKVILRFVAFRSPLRELFDEIVRLAEKYETVWRKEFDIESGIIYNYLFGVRTIF